MSKARRRLMSFAGIFKTFSGQGALTAEPHRGPPAISWPHGHRFVEGICQACGRRIEELPDLAPWERVCKKKLEGFR